TPDSLHGLLVDLFETITLWDLRSEQATVTRTSDGRYEVALDVVATQMRSDSIGHATEISMNDLIEIGVFADGKDEPLYLKRHRIVSGRQTIRVVVPSEPARAGIDPWRKLFDNDRLDNVVEVGS